MKNSKLYIAFAIAVTMLFTSLAVLTAMPFLLYPFSGDTDIRSCLLLLIPSAMFAAIARESAMYLIKN